MIKILRKLTNQIVGLLYSAEINKSDIMLKSAKEVYKAYEAILKHSKEAQKIIELDIELSKKYGFDKSYFNFEEMKIRASTLLKN